MKDSFNSEDYDELIRTQSERHQQALQELKDRSTVRVVFIVLNPDIWKYELVYRLLEQDDRFEPTVVICPATNLADEDSIFSLMNQAFHSFSDNGYNTVRSFNEETGSFLDIKSELQPDIVFFTNPYGYTKHLYQIKNFLNTLTCYVQYSFIMEDADHFYNKVFHSLLWKAFYETQLHKEQAVKYSLNKASNVEITGYPGTDMLIYGKRTENGVWKNSNKNLKRIIWAPHWSVVPRRNGRPSASNFLSIADFMMKLASRYQDQIQIAFKPHPYLKRILYDLDEWGKEKTDAFYEKWASLDNGQLETGNYTELFNDSDAMILDSISFIAEYLHCGKPSLFLKSTVDMNVRFNKFGNLALDHHYHGFEKDDIVKFIDRVILNGEDPMKPRRDRFYREVLTPEDGKSASENIYNILCDEIFDEEQSQQTNN